MTLRPKLHEVSRVAGVSLATVSRVLNAKPGVASETRQKVLATLADLGYREPVQSARTGVVAIVTPELDNPIFPALAQTIEARLARYGLLTMVCPATSDTVGEQEYLDHFAETRAAGVVVVNGRYAAFDIGFDSYVQLMRRSIPVVLVNAVAGECPVPAVAVDIASGGEMAVHHLANMGHTRIGVLVGPRRYTSTLQLLEGYETAMAGLGLAVDDDQVSETLFTVEGGRAGVAKLIEAGVTGVICGGDLMALGAIEGLRARRLDTPADMSVVGFDGTDLISHTDPPLTSIRQPVDRMAASVAWLLRNQDSAETAATGVHLFQPDLVIGRTTGRVPV
jgi:LacI family transcriptional regulator, repressor for deo operon, udp, cdd, tsx, nupC, and nupG